MYKTGIWIFLMAGVFFSNIASWFVLFSSERRKAVQSVIQKKDSRILSIVEGDLKNDGFSVKVVKSRTVNGITLDFYSEIQNGNRYLISHVLIPNGKEDGFFDYRSEAVQLAVVDLDGDGKMELVSPAFNDKLTAFLNPYHFSSKVGAFIPFFFRNQK